MLGPPADRPVTASQDSTARPSKNRSRSRSAEERRFEDASEVVQLSVIGYGLSGISAQFFAVYER